MRVQFRPSILEEVAAPWWLLTVLLAVVSSLPIQAGWVCQGEQLPVLSSGETPEQHGYAGRVFDDSYYVLAPGEKQLSFHKFGFGVQARRPTEIAFSLPPYLSGLALNPSVNVRAKFAWMDFGQCRLVHRTGAVYLAIPPQSNGLQMHLITLPNAWTLEIPSKNEGITYRLKAALPFNLGRMIFRVADIPEPATGVFAMTYLKLGGQLQKIKSQHHVFTLDVSVIPFAVGKGVSSGQFSQEVTLDASLYQPRIKPLHFGLSLGGRYRYVNDGFYVGADLHFGNVDLETLGVFIPDWFAFRKHYLYAFPNIDIGMFF